MKSNYIRPMIVIKLSFQRVLFVKAKQMTKQALDLQVVKMKEINRILTLVDLVRLVVRKTYSKNNIQIVSGKIKSLPLID